MSNQLGKKQLGATLIELMLVSVVIGMMFVMYLGYTNQRTRTITIDRASQQMQQVLNAALSFYVANGEWPADLAALQAPTPYIPTPFTSPWGTTYTATPVQLIAAGPPARYLMFSVSVNLAAGLNGADAIGAALAGKLPAGVSTTGISPTTVTATVNLPGQNVNNATAVNFAGLYKQGACVPVPSCPFSDASGNPMTPEIIITPVSLAGANDAGTTNAYPITSFTAYASGAPSANPPSCSGGAGVACTAGSSPSGNWWRACVRVDTSRGTVAWGGSILPPVMMAITRCIIQNEPAGDNFSVFNP
jgi:type II secretory pathway pseudopilin PulG